MNDTTPGTPTDETVNLNKDTVPDTQHTPQLSTVEDYVIEIWRTAHAIQQQLHHQGPAGTVQVIHQ